MGVLTENVSPQESLIYSRQDLWALDLASVYDTRAYCVWCTPEKSADNDVSVSVEAIKSPRYVTSEIAPTSIHTGERASN